MRVEREESVSNSERRTRWWLALLVLALAWPASAQDQDPGRALASRLPALVERVEPAVVQVFVTRVGPSTGDPRLVQSRQTVTGAGVIVDPAGYILTNHHVVEGARRIQVVLPSPRETGGERHSIVRPSGRWIGARLVGSDLETDLAVLKIEAPDLVALPFADSEAVRKGQLVFALGSPRGLTGSVSMGVVSAIARQFGDESPMIYLQSDVAVNPGNSGGPLVDVDGHVVGINSFIVTDSGGSEGLSFAVPSNIARTVYEEIRTTGRVRRGVIGVHPQTITPLLATGLDLSRDWGVVLGDVYPGTPAALAGLRPGDVVVSLDGKGMENARQFRVNLYGKTIGGTVRLEILRGGATRTVEVGVAERPGDPARFGDLVDPRQATIERLGILGIDLDRDLRTMFGGQLRSERGVIVAAVLFSLSPTGDDLQPGDVVRTVNGRAVTNVEGLRGIVDGLVTGDSAVLQVERAGRLQFVAVRIDS